MPRKITRRESNAAAPRERLHANSRLNPVAPLRTIAEPERLAANLAKALKLGNGVWSQVHEEHKADNRVQSKTDALTGNFDESLKDAPSYMNTWLKTTKLAEFQAFSAKVPGEMETWRKKRAAKGEPITAEEAQQKLNEIYSGFLRDKDGTLKPWLDNKAAAATVLPAMQKYRRKLLSSTVSKIKTNEKRRFVSALNTVVASNYEETGEVDYDALHDRLMKGKLDGPETNRAMVSLLTTLAVEKADPTLIEKLPAKWSNGHPTFKNSTAYRDNLLSAKSQAARARAAKRASARAAMKVSLQVAWERGIKEGQSPTVKEVVQEGPAGTGILSDQETYSWAKRIIQSEAENIGQTYGMNIVERGNGAWAWFMPKSKATHLINRKVRDAPKGKRLQMAIHMAQENGIAATAYRRFLSNVTPQSHDSFARAYDIWNTIYSANPRIAHMFTDENTAALFQSMKALEGTASPEQLIARMAQSDPDAPHPQISDPSEYLDAFDGTTFQQNGLTTNDIEGDGVENRAEMMMWATKKANALLRTGLFYSKSDAFDRALEMVQDQTFYSNGYLVPSTGNMPQDFPESVDSFYKKVLPDLLEGTDYSVDEVVLMPDHRSMRDRQTLQVYVKGTRVPVFPGKRITYQSIYKLYHSEEEAAAKKDLEQAQGDYAEKKKQWGEAMGQQHGFKDPSLWYMN